MPDNLTTPAYLWFDAEFTSLDVAEARLLQVALIATDPALRRRLPPERDLCLNVRIEPDAPVSPWVAEHLGGLVRTCRSESAVPVAEVDRQLAAAVDAAVGIAAADVKRRPVLAGNSVHMDMAMVRKFLPEFARRLHYRLLDVSALKVVWNDWFPGRAFDKETPSLVAQNLPGGFALPPAGAHDALYDIHASLAELNYYRRGLGVG